MSDSVPDYLVKIRASDIKPFDLLGDDRRVRSMERGKFNFPVGGWLQSPKEEGVKVVTGHCFAVVRDVVDGRKVWGPQWEDLTETLYRYNVSLRVRRGVPFRDLDDLAADIVVRHERLVARLRADV